MRKRFWGAITTALFLVVVSSSAMAQRPRPRPAASAPAANDLKIVYRMTTSGHSMENTTMLKGSRERSEMKLGHGRDIISVTQCDLRRTLQISESARKYVVTPMDTEVTGPSTSVAPVNKPNEPARRGGVITYTITSVDTGERKEMFGFQARHIKRTMVMESSPDACNPVKHRMETDGWYIDFSYGLNCETAGVAMTPGGVASGGCRDQVRFNHQGAARVGYPLLETTTSYGADGSVAFTSTREVIELSRSPLDAALFDIPAGYTETKNAQELYGMPSMESMTSQTPTPGTSTQGVQQQAQAGRTKGPGVIRIGVIQINNRSGKSISTESLRNRLLAEIQEEGPEAVSLNAISLTEAEAEAKAKQCDFILFTDITTLKTSAAKKLGGMFGRAAGIGGIDKTEAKVEFKLFAVGESAARLQSAAASKDEGDEVSVGNALEQEAKQVSVEVRRNRG